MASKDNPRRQAEDKLEKPHAHFDRPQDARQLTTAAQEGMTGGEENKLQEVLVAKRALKEPGGAPDLPTADNPPPGSDAEVAEEAEIEKLDP